MTDHPTDKLDDLLDRYVNGLLDEESASRVRRRIEQDPEWQLAYESAIERRKTLSRAIRDGAAKEAARSAPSADDVLGVIRGEKTRSRPLLGWTMRIPLAAAAAVALFLVSAWIYSATLTAPDTVLRVFARDASHLAGGPATVVATVTDAQGQKLSNVPVELTLRDPRTGRTETLVKSVTNQAGAIAGNPVMPDWEPGEYVLEASTPRERLAVVTVPIKLERKSRVYLSTDKPIYQPGQTLHMRALSLKLPSLKPLKGAEGKFTVTDPAGNVIFSQEEKLGEFGLAGASMPIDPLISPGQYKLRAEFGGVDSEQTVEIFHYKLPAFTIDLDLDKPYYLPGEKVTGTLTATYTFGKPVSEGKVQLWLADRATARLTTLVRDTLTTDEKGKAEFSLQLPDSVVALRKTANTARLLLTAQLSDSAGQENTNYANVVVSGSDIRIEVVVENGALNPGLANRVFIATSYPDGRPAQTRVNLENFAQSVRTDETGIAIVEMKRAPQQLVVSASDAKGRSGKRTVKVPVAAGGQLILRTDRPTYKAGQTAKIEVLTDRDDEVYVDVVRDGQTYLTKIVPVQDGRGTLSLDIPASLYGTLRLHAYRLDQEGEWVGRDALMIVEPASQLQVKVRRDQSVYRPGEDAVLVFDVTDETGNGVPAALSLAGIDSAVLAVRQAAPGLEAVLNSLDEELLKPAIEVHGFTPLGIQHERYAAAMLAAAAPSPHYRKPQPVRTPMERLERLTGYGIGEMDQQQWETTRKATLARIEANPGLRDHVSPEVMEILQGKTTFAIDEDTALTAARAHAREKDQAERATRYGVLALAAVVGGTLLILAVRFVFSAPMDSPSAAQNFFGVVGRIAIVLVAIVVVVVATSPLYLPSLSKARAMGTEPQADALPMLVPITQRFSRWSAGESMTGAVPTAEGLADARWKDAPLDHLHDTDFAPDRKSDESAPRMRNYFPETLLWKPCVITDPTGRATLRVPLADSITTWNISGWAVSQGGQLGTVEADVRVFQPFFVSIDAPQTLTRGDEVSVPIVVYNYADTTLDVSLQAAGADGLTVLSDGQLTVRVQPGKVVRKLVRVRAEEVGRAALSVEARGGDFADAMRRELTIVPPGLPQAFVLPGMASPARDVVVDIPPHAEDGSISLQLKVYPSTFSELMDGLENILRMPSGCFEQTSSATWPNVMALSYMKANGMSNPAVHAKAKRYIELGYQRLVGFEVRGGGFDWFGRGPANEVLTAYGLMEFADMSKVHHVDPKLLKRTADWLASKQAADGSWSFREGCFHEPFTGGDNSRLAITAYVTWAIAQYAPKHAGAQRGAEYVAAHVDEADNVHTLAIIANALRASKGFDSLTARVQDRLAGKADRSQGDQAFWDAKNPVTATATAVLALVGEAEHSALVNDALRYLAASRDSYGTWGSTQPTVLALRALLAGSQTPVKRDSDAVFTVTDADGATVGRLSVEPGQSDIVHTLTLDGDWKPGSHALRIETVGAKGMGYQLIGRYYTQQIDTRSEAPVTVEVEYDRTKLSVGDTVRVKAIVRNRTGATANMPLVDIGTPPGFAVRSEGLEKLKAAGRIARYTITARGVIVYLTELAPKTTLEIEYDMVARMPLKAKASPSKVYNYYEPDKIAAATPVEFVVAE